MAKNGLRNKLEGDELDLSMLGLTEVPVKDIASLPKATKVDLSNNQLTSLPSDFCSRLGHITRLDLGSNKLKYLPDDIDKLQNLKHLDLYNNQLQDLPVSFCHVRSLRWLDLKGNPLSSGLLKAAGDCLNNKECELAARRVITYLKRFHVQMENEKQERLRKEKEMEAARVRAEEEQAAKKREEKRQAKEKKKAEHLAQMKSSKQANGSAVAQQKYVAVQKTTVSVPKNKKKTKKSSWSCLGWVNFFLTIFLMAAVGAGLFVYTNGDLTPDGVAAAYPKLAENWNKLANLTIEALQPSNLMNTLQLVGTNIREVGSSAWVKLEEQTGDLSMYTDPVLATLAKAWLAVKEFILAVYNWLATNIDWNAILEGLKSVWKFLRDQWLMICEELSKNEAFMSFISSVKGYVSSLWEYLGVLWVALCHQISIVIEYIREEGPGVLSAIKEQATNTFYNAKNSIEGLMK